MAVATAKTILTTESAFPFSAAYGDMESNPSSTQFLQLTVSAILSPKTPENGQKLPKTAKRVRKRPNFTPQLPNRNSSAAAAAAAAVATAAAAAAAATAAAQLLPRPPLRPWPRPWPRTILQKVC